MPLAEDASQAILENPSRDLPPLPNDPLDFTGKDAPSVCLPPFYIFFFLFTPAHQELKKCTGCGPPHLLEGCSGPIDPNNMDLGNSSYLISLSGISHLFLDDPEVSVPDAEATARPSSVRLPYALVPGMDTTSRAYQKAAALLGQVVQETSNPRPTLPLGYTLSETSFGN